MRDLARMEGIADVSKIPMACGAVVQIGALMIVSVCKEYYQFFLGMYS
jgi:hypothetical protein